jgi:hypothetical protein
MHALQECMTDKVMMPRAGCARVSKRRRSITGVTSGALQDARQGAGELARLERLSQDFGDADGEGALGEHRPGVAAHHHDRQVGSALAQGAREHGAGNARQEFVRD